MASLAEFPGSLAVRSGFFTLVSVTRSCVFNNILACLAFFRSFKSHRVACVFAFCSPIACRVARTASSIEVGSCQELRRLLN
jgi:hypothetical protein